MADDTTQQNPNPVAPALGESAAERAADATSTTGEAPAVGFHEMSREERHAFLDKGTTPKREGKPKSSDGKAADSSTAAESAAKTEKAASETADPGKDKKARNSEENRVQELLADRKRADERAERAEREREDLRKRLEALESKPKADGKSDSSTAADPSEPKWKKYRAMKDAPKITDFADPDDWGAAMSLFIAEQVAKDTAAAVFDERGKATAEELAAHQEFERVVNTAADRLEADEKAHPELIEKVHPKLRELVPMRLLPSDAKPTADHFMKDCISFESDHPLQLSAFYSTEEGWAEWESMRRMDRRGIERTIARRDLSFGATSTPGEVKPGATDKAVPKTFTKTPPPPEKTGPKGAASVDAAEQAVKSGNFGAFNAALDAKEGTGGRRYGVRRG